MIPEIVLTAFISQTHPRCYTSSERRSDQSSWPLERLRVAPG